MNLCWFCAHPGTRNLDPSQTKNIILAKVCEAHLDYEVFYTNDTHPQPVPMTPRLVLQMAKQIEIQLSSRTN